MGNSPFRSTLYRTGWRGVICAVLMLIGVAAWAQFARKNTVSKGPRAVGLLMMPAKGKPRLIPVAIMVDGRFYDAGAYKADPVPMALEPGTVYEVERTGESLGLFTITQDLQQKNNWIAEGTYHANGEQVASSGHKAETKPREEADEGPPKLKRPGSESKPATAAPESKPASPAGQTKPASPPPNESTTASAAPAPKPEAEAAPEDPNVPRLRRGKPEKSAEDEESVSVAVKPTTPAKPNGVASSTGKNSATPQTAADVQTIPAISDAAGPEPHPYKYEMSPGEEEGFRLKMLAMATDELRKQAKAFQAAAPGSTASPRTARQRRPAPKTTSQAPLPAFDDVQLRVFDISASNEPIIVFSATAHPPPAGKEEIKSADYYVTLVTRSDIYGELRKLFFVVTDSEHLDVNPRMQLIDAVDADGDGRGELLFRQISDAGTAYAIYRVHPDQLWSLYEGTPQ